MIAIFNNDNVFIGYCDKVPQHITKYKELGNDFDPTTSYWDGDFETGTLKNINTKKISEFQLEESFVEKVKKIYANEISHILCIKQLYLISEKLNCFDENFKIMCDDIMPLIEYYDDVIKSLKENDQLETKEEIYEKHKSVFK